MPPDRLRIRARDWDRLTAHLQACLPEEGCGLLAGRRDEVELMIPVENSDHSPVHYHMEDRALIQAFNRVDRLGLELLGAFHSHPIGPDGVSRTDLQEWHYPEAALVVCTLHERSWLARGFVVEHDGPRQIPIVVEPD